MSLPSKFIKIKPEDHPIIWGTFAGIVLLPTALLVYFLGEKSLPFVIVLSVLYLTLTIWQLYRMLYQNLQDERVEQQAYLNILKFLDVKAPLPPMHSWTASPNLVAKMLTLMMQQKTQVVVEFGSGVSTLTTGYFLKQQGSGKIISFDHHEAFLNYTRDNIAFHGLSEIVTLIHAPLKTVTINGHSRKWYDIGSPFDQNLKVDILVVDGPPRSIQSIARYPALPVVYPFLSKGAYIILDDAGNPDGKKIIDRWTSEFPDIKLIMIDGAKGIAIFQKQ